MAVHTHTVRARGITLLEIVTVVAVVALIAALAWGAFSRFAREHALERGAQYVASTLEDARSRSIAAQDDAVHGVHFQSDRVVRFTGASFSAGDPNNKEVRLPGETAITDVSFTGGASEVVFSKDAGEADVDGSVTVALRSDAARTITVHVTRSGFVEAVE